MTALPTETAEDVAAKAIASLPEHFRERMAAVRRRAEALEVVVAVEGPAIHVEIEALIDAIDRHLGSESEDWSYRYGGTDLNRAYTVLARCEDSVKYPPKPAASQVEDDEERPS